VELLNCGPARLNTPKSSPGTNSTGWQKCCLLITKSGSSIGNINTSVTMPISAVKDSSHIMNHRPIVSFIDTQASTGIFRRTWPPLTICNKCCPTMAKIHSGVVLRGGGQGKARLPLLRCLTIHWPSTRCNNYVSCVYMSISNGSINGNLSP